MIFDIIRILQYIKAIFLEENIAQRISRRCYQF